MYCFRKAVLVMFGSGTVAGSKSGAFTELVSTSESSRARRMAWSLKPATSQSEVNIPYVRLAALVVCVGEHEEHIAEHVEEVLLVELVGDLGR